MSKKKTTKEFQEELDIVFGNNQYQIMEEYINGTTKILVKHLICRRSWKVQPRIIATGNSSCPYCAKQNRVKSVDGKFIKQTKPNSQRTKLESHSGQTNAKKTTNDFKKEVFDKHGKEYTVLGEYINNSTNILIRHNPCGTEFEVNPYNFITYDRKCRVCNPSKTTSGKFKLNKNGYQEKLNEIYPNNEYNILEEYKGTNKSILTRHNECGHEWLACPSGLIARSTSCPKCAIKLKTLRMFYGDSKDNLLTDSYLKSKTLTEGFKFYVDRLYYNEYTVLGEYLGTHKKILVKHNECGHEFRIEANKLISSFNGCPKCNQHRIRSGLEQEILDYIESIYDSNVVSNQRGLLINNRELDIYLPELNLAIEVDGLYWHSEICVDNRDALIKTLECDKLGIRLIHIFEDEWNYKENIVKSKLKNLICKDSIKIYARKCWIEEINPSDKNTFLEENHIQGGDKSNIKLSLWTSVNNEEICVAVMTFCKPRRSLGQTKNSSYDYELSRYATQSGYSIIGGFSKLLKYFERNYEWKKIITYADIRWSSLDSNVYLTNGFNKLPNSEPNYWYITKSPTKRLHRYGYRKQVLKEKFPEIYNEDKTERKIMKEAGFIRIYDCGNMVYEYIK